MLQHLCPIALSIFLDFSNPTATYITRYGLPLLPMFGGIYLQTILEDLINSKTHPHLSKFSSKFMTSFNTVLALPAISPLTSQLEKNLFSFLQTNTNENSSNESPSSFENYLENLWTESHKQYSTHARSSRYVIHEAQEIVASASQRARDSIQNKEYHDAANILADLAIRLRLDFSEFAPSDSHLLRTFHVYLGKNNLDLLQSNQIKTETLNSLFTLDPEYENSKTYYDTLMNEWFGPQTQLYLVVGLDPRPDPIFKFVKGTLPYLNFLQLDPRKMDKESALELANKLRSLCTNHKISFYINTDLELALSVKADGVHFMSATIKTLKEAKIKLGNQTQIGLSVNNIEESKLFEPYIDYFSLGPIYHSQTFHQIEQKGLDLLDNLVKVTSKPVFAAGGIQSQNVEQVLKLGVAGVVIREHL